MSNRCRILRSYQGSLSLRCKRRLAVCRIVNHHSAIECPAALCNRTASCLSWLNRRSRFLIFRGGSLKQSDLPSAVWGFLLPLFLAIIYRIIRALSRIRCVLFTTTVKEKEKDGRFPSNHFFTAEVVRRSQSS